MKPIASLCLLASLALAAGASAAAPDRASRVVLRSVDFDVREPVAVPSSLAADAAVALTPGGAASELVLVKYPRPVGARERAALAASVERVLIYLPHDAFLVRVPRGTGESLVPAGASWVGPYHPLYKVSPEAAAVAADPGARAADRPVPVLLHLDPGTDLAAAAAALDGLGAGRVVGAAAKERLSRVRLLMTPVELAGALETLARFTEVVWIELEGRRVLLNDTTAWVGQSGTAGGQATPVHDAGILGEGQVIAVLDTGLDADMCYFHHPAEGLPVRNECDGGTAVNADHRKVLAVDFLWSTECAGGISDFEWDTQGHGSHVAGIAAGDQAANGVRDAGDGMAPAAKLVIQDGGFAFDNCADLPGLGCPVVDLVPIFQQSYDQGARFHSNSWGDRENFTPHNIYSAGSEDADEFMWNHRDFLLVFAAGNEGQVPDSVLSPSTAKNVVAVGSTLRGAQAETPSSFSSCGWTEDDRVKPDVMMPGSEIVSAGNNGNVNLPNCSMAASSGTSMAAPGAAGFAALVRQYLEDGFYPSGTAMPADEFAPSAALIKATMLNSTHQMANVAPIPSPCQGWGRLQLDRALYLGSGDRRLWVEDNDTGFAGPGTRTFFFEAGGAAEPLRATLTWTDFPSTPAAGAHLVNDLDLEVVGPGGALLGNVLSGGVSIPGGSPDRIDTVEQVLIALSPAGPYRVEVSAFAVPSGPQPFALVLSGDLVPAIFADGFESGDSTTWSATTP
jgi:hypothetical protein